MTRAFLASPQSDILLSDEPTAGLDPITAEEIGGLIVEMKKQRQMTSVVVTHDIHQAKVFADRLVLIDQGHVVREGTFDDLQKSEDEFVRRFLKDARC